LGASLPVSSTESDCGIPTIDAHASICWATSGRVGAMKMIFPPPPLGSVYQR